MSGAVWLNGSFVDRAEARVGAFDAGMQHGVGLFETMLARGSDVVDLGRQVADNRRACRLVEAAQEYLGHLVDMLETHPPGER